MAKTRSEISAESVQRRKIKHVALTERARDALVKHRDKQGLKSLSEAVEWIDKEIKILRMKIKRGKK